MGRNRPDGGFWGGEEGSMSVFVWSATMSCQKHLQRKMVVHGAGARGFKPPQVNA